MFIGKSSTIFNFFFADLSRCRFVSQLSTYISIHWLTDRLLIQCFVSQLSVALKGDKIEANTLHLLPLACFS